MDRLWAPWRIEYVSRIKTKGCVFCRILKEKNDRKNFVVFRSRYCFAILNTYPYNNGHLMIVPGRHTDSLEDLKEPELLDISRVLVKTKSVIKKILKPSGFNIGMNIGKVAGAGIDKHIHIHLVPRWPGDVNYMPVIANTKVVSQSLKELYLKLKKGLSPFKQKP